MRDQIESLAKCEVCSVIHFLNENKFCATDIHGQIMEVNDDNIMNKVSVRKLHIIFNGVRSNVHSDKSSN